MSGHSCCIVGCSACYTRNKGLTFHRLPKKSSVSVKEEWRNRLINIISRADSSFNPDKAHICSRHFEEEAFTPHGKKKLQVNLHEKYSVNINQSMHTELKDIIDGAKIDDPFAKLFWEQQKKAFDSKDHGMKWHPMMIRLAIMIRSQSQSAYASLRETGVLRLPGESTLRDYTNVIHPKEGFNFDVLKEIKHATQHFKENERYVVLLHDEMSVKSDLVFDRRSDEVVGFLHPEKWKVEDDNLATHALVFMVVGINTNLKMTLGFFGTKTATADYLFWHLWEAIGYLESYCGLKVGIFLLQHNHVTYHFL